MSLEKREKIIVSDFNQNRCFSVHKVTQFIENGVVVGESKPHTHVVTPLSDLTNEDQLVKDLCSGDFHSQKVKDEYRALLDANKPKDV